MVTHVANGSGLKNNRKRVVVVGVSLLAIIVISAGVLIHKNNHKSYSAAQLAELANQASFTGNQTQALKYAKQALAKAPNNLDDIELVASLTKARDPAAAKSYYEQEYEIFKRQNNPDAASQPVGIYWAAAELAHEAGQTGQAIKYYQQVIQVADPSDSYQQSLIEKAQVQLAGLK